MANPILKSDLIEDGLQQELDKLLKTITEIGNGLAGLRGGVTQYAQSMNEAVRGTHDNAEEMTKMAARITQLEEFVKKLTAAERENDTARRAANEQKRLYRKLTDDEIKSVEDLKRALAGSVEEQMAAVKAIDTEKKSYNELNQTYNALKDTLNKLTTEQRNNTEAGRAMTASALKIRDTMNELQKATGNYTLQVGKYKAAFDGLGFSFMQILREAPSALNLNQFFLAISNNLPLFFDQLTAYTKSMKTELAQLQAVTNKTAEETARMAELTEITGSKVKTFTAVVKRLGTAMFSLQGAVLAFTLILRFLPKIIEWVKELFGNVKELVSETMKLRWAMADLWNDVENKVSNTAAELRILVNRLEAVKRGTEEYATIVGRINEITNSTLNTTTAQIDEVKRLTKAYMEQQIQLATNAEVVGRIGRNRANIRKRDTALTAGLPAADRARSITSDTEQQEELTKMLEEHEKAVNAYNDAVDKGIKDRVVRYRKREINALGEWVDREYVKLEYRPATEKELTRLDQERMHWKVSAERYINDILGIVSQDIMDAWAAEYKAVLTEDKKNGPKGKQPSEQEMNNQFWEAAEARRNIMLVGYQKELADEKAAHLQQMQEQARANEEMQKAVEENVNNGFITREEGNRRIQELQKQNDNIMEGLILEHHKRVNEINTKYAEMDRQVVVEEELGWIEILDKAYKVDENNRRRRIKTIKDEEQSNLRITESILKMREEIEKLQEKNLTQPEAIEQRTKRIQELEKAIAKLQTQIDHTKQLSNYSSVGDIFRRNVSVGAGTQQSLMESILGKDAYSAFAPGSKELEEAIEKDFDTWMQSAEKSLSTWYSTTMGYINDLISAYVELANAKAEAAAEATEAAQEEYDKEKALLEAGYASRVEATWAEYQEKKAAQEKAEADAKAAAQAQKELNEMQTAGSMIVAAANIWKTFSGMGPVGIALAAVATAGMFAAFVASKAKAAEVSKYGEGGFEVLEGGSHASGHDIDLGVNNRKGRRMRAEGKEGLGIFSRRAMAHYGANNIEAMVNSVNRLEFEGNAAKRMSLERSVGMAVLSAPRTDLHKLENSVDKLVSYGSRSRTVNADGSVTEYRKNGVVTIKKG